MGLDMIYCVFPKLDHIVRFEVGFIMSLYSLPKAKASVYQVVNN